MVHFVVHQQEDSVGVVVVEGVEAGQELNGWLMDSDTMITCRANQDIPIGHKIALRDHGVEQGVIKYGEDIGRVVAAIKTGEHVHVHNLKTRRW